MTQTGYSNAIVSVMLGWLKGLASWVLKLFDLAGGGASPLLWLSNNWLKLLILLLIVGVGIDLLVWMLRWRPYWVWFRKKRIIVNDKRFFADGDVVDWLEEDPEHFKKEYVVPSTVVKQKQPRVQTAVVPPRAKRAASPQNPAKRTARPQAGQTPRKRPSAAPESKRVSHDVFSDDMFEVGNRQGGSDFFEDEVFNVANLPEAAKKKANAGSRKKRR